MSGSMPTISSTRIAAPSTSPPGGTWSTGMRLLIATSIATAVTDHRHVEVAAQGTAASTHISLDNSAIFTRPLPLHAYAVTLALFLLVAAHKRGQNAKGS